MHIHSPRRHVHNGRCTSIRRGDTFTMGDERPFAGATRSQWAMPPSHRTARLCRGPAIPDEFAPPDGCIAPTPNPLRRGVTFTMGDAHPLAEAIRSPRAMPPLNRTARLCRGPVIPDEFTSPDGCIAPTPDSLRPSVGRGTMFTMGDAHPFAGATRSLWAMPPLNGTARLCRGPAIPDDCSAARG